MKYVFIILFALLISSCKDENHAKYIEPIQKAFIENYVYPESCILDYIINNEGNIVISINITGDVYSQHSPNTSEAFWKYAYQYGDTTYNNISPPIPIMCSTKLHQIDIICDKDFDENHKALVSLSDITDYRSTSYKHFIQSFYKDLDTWFTKNLSEMSGDDYLFLDADGSMGLVIKGSNKLPKGEYKFTVIFVTEDNNTVKSDITIAM